VGFGQTNANESLVAHTRDDNNGRASQMSVADSEFGFKDFSDAELEGVIARWSGCFSVFCS
jgi:hypothetical protein